MNEEIILKKFAERFSELVKNSSIDVPKLAQMLGIKSNSTIYRYMNAEMAPKVPTVKYLSEIFNVNPLWLMGYDVSREIQSNDFRYASYNGIDTEGLDENDIEEINRFVEFVRNKKKNENKKD